MLRFPNPVSTIDTFVSVYVAAFERLNGQAVSLDDIVKAVVAANLATSSGYMGKEAVLRSTRDDRSRDSLYNQLKMYASYSACSASYTRQRSHALHIHLRYWDIRWSRLVSNTCAYSENAHLGSSILATCLRSKGFMSCVRLRLSYGLCAMPRAIFRETE